MQQNMPFGDSFIVQTPQLDAYVQRNLQQQKEAAFLKERQRLALDDLFSSNIYKIRDADADDYAGLFNDWKEDSLRIQSLGNIATEQDRRNNMMKKAAMFKFGSSSIDRKNWEETQGKNMLKNNSAYADDAETQMYNLRKIPISKITPDMDAKLAYPYDFKDFDKTNRLAIGEVKDFTGKMVAPGQQGHSGVDKMQDETPIYKIGNNPNRQYDILWNDIMGRNKQKNAEGLIFNSFQSPQEIEDLKNKYYQKIKDPKYVAAYGEPSSFPESSNTKLGQAISLQVMKNVVNTPTPEPTIRRTPNQNIKLTRQENFKREQQAIREDNINKRAALSARYRTAKPGIDLNDYDTFSLLDKEVKEIELPFIGKKKVLPMSSLQPMHKKYFEGIVPYFANGQGYYLSDEETGNFSGSNKSTDRMAAAIDYSGKPAQAKSRVLNSGAIGGGRSNPKPSGNNNPKPTDKPSWAR